MHEGERELTASVHPALQTALWAALTLKPGSVPWSTDVCVPLSRMADCITAVKEDIAKEGMIAPIVGHVGDGACGLLVGVL